MRILLAGNMKSGSKWIRNGILENTNLRLINYEQIANMELASLHNLIDHQPQCLFNYFWRLYRSEDVIKRADKVVISYREPISAGISLWRAYNHGLEGRQKSKQIHDTNQQLTTYYYISRDELYNSMLNGYMKDLILRRFDHDNIAREIRMRFGIYDICEVLFDDIVKNPEYVINKILKFCGFKPATPVIPVKVGAGYYYKNSLSHWLVNALFYKLTGVSSTCLVETYMMTNRKKSFFTWLYSINESSNEDMLSEKQRQKLKDVYRDTVYGLEKATRIQVSDAWGY